MLFNSVIGQKPPGHIPDSLFVYLQERRQLTLGKPLITARPCFKSGLSGLL